MSAAIANKSKTSCEETIEEEEEDADNYSEEEDDSEDENEENDQSDSKKLCGSGNKIDLSMSVTLELLYTDLHIISLH